MFVCVGASPRFGCVCVCEPHPVLGAVPYDGGDLLASHYFTLLQLKACVCVSMMVLCVVCGYVYLQEKKKKFLSQRLIYDLCIDSMTRLDISQCTMYNAVT